MHADLRMDGKQQVKKVFSKRENELLCEMDSLTTIIEWIDEDEIDLEQSIIPVLEAEDTYPIIKDLHE